MDNSGTAIPTLYLLLEIGFAAAHAEPFYRKTSIPGFTSQVHTLTIHDNIGTLLS
jgi:hypothetical protein